MMRIILAVSFLFLSMSMACTPKPSPVTPSASPGDIQAARDTLEHFFELLNNGRYAEAVPFYGGSYDSMRDNNPGISDSAALMQNACEINGVMCLQPRTILLDQVVTPLEFHYQVEFQTEDGELFVRGPCCGANSTDQPSESVFTYRVIRNSRGSFQVMDMPPYVP